MFFSNPQQWFHAIDFQQELQNLSISHIDLVSGGPPCQGFSTVGSKNEKDPRNSLFYEYLRAVNEIKPNYIIFEKKLNQYEK
jgi:DNA (cytosine-5)-methyltransferase 1